MGDFFELNKSVYITKDLPVDGLRYLAATHTVRNKLVEDGRAFPGLQVFTESDSKVWLCTSLSPADVGTWEELGSGGGITPGDINFIDLGDTPGAYTSLDHDKLVKVRWDADPTAAGLEFSSISVSDLLVTNDIIDNLTTQTTDQALSANQGYVLDQAVKAKKDDFTENTAFNKNFLTGVAADADEIVGSHAGTSDDVARADHDHAGLYYKMSEVDSKIIGASQGIKGTWPVPQDMRDKIGLNDASDGEMWILDANTPPASPPVIVGTEVDTALENRAVYRWDLTNTIWKFVYLMDADHNHDNLYEPKNINIQAHVTQVGGNPHEVTAKEVEMSADAADSFDTTLTVGGIAKNTTISNTEDVYQILKDLLSPVLNPYKQNSASIGIDLKLKAPVPPSNLYEVGSSVADIWGTNLPLGVGSFYKGTIKNGIDVPSTSDLTGNITSQSFSSVGNGFITDSSGNVSGVLAQGVITFTITGNTLKGTAPYWDSNGDGTVGTAVTIPSIEAQRGPLVLTGSASIYGGYYLIYGESETAAAIPTDRSLIDSPLNKYQSLYLTGSRQVSILSGSGVSTKKLYIYVPPTIPADEANVRLLNESSADDNLIDYNSVISVDIPNKSGVNVTYNRFDINIDGVGFSGDQNLRLEIGTASAFMAGTVLFY